MGIVFDFVCRPKGHHGFRYRAWLESDDLQSIDTLRKTENRGRKRKWRPVLLDKDDGEPEKHSDRSWPTRDKSSRWRSNTKRLEIFFSLYIFWSPFLLVTNRWTREWKDRWESSRTGGKYQLRLSLGYNSGRTALTVSRLRSVHQTSASFQNLLLLFAFQK